MNLERAKGERAGDNIERVHNLFGLWERITGRRVLANYENTYAAHEFLKNGFTEQDMERVVKRVKWLIEKKEWPGSVIWFHKLVGDLNRFNELLNDCRAADRNRPKPPTPRDRALMDTHRSPVDTAPPDPKHVKEHLKRLADAIQ